MTAMGQGILFVIVAMCVNYGDTFTEVAKCTNLKEEFIAYYLPRRESSELLECCNRGLQ